MAQIQNTGDITEPAAGPGADEIAAFIERWSPAAAAERSSYQIFLTEFTRLMNLPEILSPGMKGAEGYRFEKPVQFYNAYGPPSSKRVDLYRHKHFILEAKQGAKAKPGSLNQIDIFKGTPRAEAQTKRNNAERGSKAWERAMGAAYHQAG